MQIMYGIEGETRLTEKELNHLSGYENSKPVRIGNAAYNQKQNDIYGSLIDVIYLYYVFYQYEKKMPLKYWQFIKYLVHEIETNWQTEDHGIWEFRNEKKHFVYSKLMCYIGISRALRIAKHLDKKKFIKKWSVLKEKIKLDILKNGWNDKQGSFTMYYGSSSLDAANLMMSYHDFLGDDDQMLISTIKSTKENLCDDYLVQRYKVKDDFGRSKNSFTICSFWLVDALYNSGMKKEAKRIYKKLMRNSNHLGLFSEDIDKDTKELLGNFPQAYTHIAIINSSILLSEWDEKRIKLEFDSKKKKIK
jgi:GH15 family glucan-1,4-alpha-glucosidase